MSNFEFSSDLATAESPEEISEEEEEDWVWFEISRLTVSSHSAVIAVCSMWVQRCSNFSSSFTQA